MLTIQMIPIQTHISENILFYLLHYSILSVLFNLFPLFQNGAKRAEKIKHIW